MNTFFRYYWYTIRNFCKGLSVTDIAIIIIIPCLFSLWLFGLFSEIVHSQKIFLIQNLQIIKNVSPQILVLMVISSHLIFHPEKTLNRIFSNHRFYVTLPLTRNTILHWCLLVTLAKDSLWIMLGFLFTGILAYELNLEWFSFLGQTVQLIVLWVVTASLISFVALIVRIILANRIQFEKKIILKLMIFGEILLSFFIFIIILYFRIILTDYMRAHWGVNDIVIRSIFFTSIISLLYLIIHKLFSMYDHEIRKYFEMENDHYSIKTLPKRIQKLIAGNSSPLVRSILWLSLTTRSYGFTRFHSLIIFSVPAIVLLLFSISISDSTTSMIVFAIIAATVITSFFFTIFVSIPFIFVIAKPLPLSFKEIIWSYLQGGLLLSLPAFILVLILSLCLGFSNSLKTMGISALLCACVIPLRIFIASRYPYSKILSDMAFILSLLFLVLSYQLFFFLPIIGWILVVLYHRKKARELWNTADLL